jgi:hypothetical protein
VVGQTAKNPLSINVYRMDRHFWPKPLCPCVFMGWTDGPPLQGEGAAVQRGLPPVPGCEGRELTKQKMEHRPMKKITPTIQIDSKEQTPLDVHGIKGFSDWNRPAFSVERKSLDTLPVGVMTHTRCNEKSPSRGGAAGAKCQQARGEPTNRGYINDSTTPPAPQTETPDKKCPGSPPGAAPGLEVTERPEPTAKHARLKEHPVRHGCHMAEV